MREAGCFIFKIVVIPTKVGTVRLRAHTVREVEVLSGLTYQARNRT
jgi:hypothetical protein